MSRSTASPGALSTFWNPAGDEVRRPEPVLALLIAAGPSTYVGDDDMEKTCQNEHGTRVVSDSVLHWTRGLSCAKCEWNRA